MIHYQLRCDRSHEFDGWFQDSAGFEKLAKAGMVQCPVCGGTEVERALMAPAIGRRAPEPAASALAAEAQAAPANLPAAAGQPAAAGPIPAQLRAMFQRLRAEVERNCDYVGPEFAEEARRMARGESEQRGIYGEASTADAEALRDEGIEIARIPWVPPADA